MKKQLLWLLALKFLFGVCMVLFGPIHLSPDEAQYWTWSENLSIGYYSKPPGVAWQIALGTFLFGDTEFGVRFIALLFSFFLPLATYRLAKQCQLHEKGAFYAALAIAFCPVGLMASFAATTDGGFVLFFTLAFAALLYTNNLENWEFDKEVALNLSQAKPAPKQLNLNKLSDAGGSQRQERTTQSKTNSPDCLCIYPNWLLFGLFVFLGSLFKWTIFLIWLPALFVPQLRSKKVLIAIALSLLGLLPSFIWNWQHDFATFKHVWTQSTGGKGGPNPLDFFLSQIGLFFPFFFLLIAAFFQLKKAKNEIRFCLIFVLAVLILYELVSFFQKMQANWAIYIYPIASVLVAWVCLERKKLFYSCVYISIILTLILMNSIAFLPSKINLFKPTLGWNSLPDALEMAGYQPDQHFLFADNYQMTSILSFYSPGQKRAYFLNLPGHRKNQFSFWPQMAQEQLHATGYFVTGSQNSPAYFEQKLAPYFAKVHYLGTFPLYQAEKEVKIFKTEDYNGKAPQDPEKY